MNPTPATVPKRKPWLDACRGLAMIFVIYSHVDRKTTGLISIITPIMIPLFFAITGYLFNGNRKTPQQFLGKLLRRIVLPWLIFAYVQYIPGQLITTGKLNLIQITWDIFSGEVLWYMPCCILAEILFYLLNRISLSLKWRAMLCCFFFCIGYTLGRFGLGFTFALNVVFISQFYLLLGQLLRHYETKFSKLTPRCRYTLMTGLAVTFLGMCTANTLLYPDSQLNIRMNTYNCLPLTLAAICIGCMLVFMLFQSIPAPRWLCFIGRNTLVYYVLHGRFLDIFKAIYTMLQLPSGNVILVSIVITTLTCCALALCVLFLNRYLPFLTNQRSKA